MIELRGDYSTAKVFTSELEDSAKEQIETLLDQDFLEGVKVRIMPDVHKGMGCVIGFTADMQDKVIPNIVGVDIGCGMLTIELGKLDMDLKKLDKIINKEIPSGRDINKRIIKEFPKISDLYCYRELKNIKRIERSVGSLGGGNHFIGATCC